MRTEFVDTCGIVSPHQIDEHAPPKDAVYLFAPKMSQDFIGYSILRADPPLKSLTHMCLDDGFTLSRTGVYRVPAQNARMYEIEGMHDAIWANEPAKPVYQHFEGLYHSVYDAIHIYTNHVFCRSLVGLFTPTGVLECILDLGDPWKPKKLKDA